MPIRTANARWQGDLTEGSGTVSTGKGGYQGNYSFKSRFEEGEGTNPEELIAAAHAGCFTMAIGSILAGQGTPPERLNVTATVTLEVSGQPTIASSELDVHGVVPGTDAASFDRAAREAEINCPVSRALQGNVEIRVRATLDEPSASLAAH